MKKAVHETTRLIIAVAVTGLLATGCVGEGSTNYPAPDTQSKTTSLSQAMEAMDECHEVIRTLERGESATPEEFETTREEYGRCLDENGVTPPIDPFRICDVVSARVDHALEEEQVNCGLPEDVLEETLCDISTYVSNCEDFAPSEPPPTECTEDGCQTQPGAGEDDGGPDTSSGFCEDVRTTTEDAEQRDEHTTLRQQFPECFDDGHDGFEDDSSEGEGDDGFDPDDVSCPAEGEGETTDTQSLDTCRVLMDELQHAEDEETAAQILQLMQCHCGGEGGGWGDGSGGEGGGGGGGGW